MNCAGETQEVRVRVRHARDKHSLLDEESVLGTLLHELVHNVRGPHDRCDCSGTH